MSRLAYSSPATPGALSSWWRSRAWAPTALRPTCAQRQRGSKVKYSLPLWSFLWRDCPHPRPWLRKNIPLSEAKGHHVIPSWAWKGSLKQVILILKTWDNSQLRHDLFSAPRQIAQFPLLPNFPNCKRSNSCYLSLVVFGKIHRANAYNIVIGDNYLRADLPRTRDGVLFIFVFIGLLLAWHWHKHRKCKLNYITTVHLMVMEHLRYVKHCVRHTENTEGSSFYPQWAHSSLRKIYHSIKVE